MLKTKTAPEFVEVEDEDDTERLKGSICVGGR